MWLWETAEGSATKIHVTSLFLIPKTPSFSAEHSHNGHQLGEAIAPPSGVSLTSPCGPYILLRSSARGSFNDRLTGSQQVEAGRARPLGALGLLLNNPGPSSGKIQPWCTAGSFLCASRTRRGTANCGSLILPHRCPGSATGSI